MGNVKFKKGDTVRCVSPVPWEDIIVMGAVYTVDKWHDGYVYIAGTRRPGGHGGWRPDRFELVNPAPDTKDTNPKDAVGTHKVPIFSVLPLRVLGGVALSLLEGARKYGRHNYRPAGVRASVYMDAVGRHMAAWFEGEDIDPDSGVNHVDKALAGLMVLRDSMLQGNWVDDRPPAVKPGWVAELNQKAKEIIERHPEAVPAYTQKGVASE